jgi:hypothetical protein
MIMPADDSEKLLGSTRLLESPECIIPLKIMMKVIAMLRTIAIQVVTACDAKTGKASVHLLASGISTTWTKSGI